MRLAYVLAPVLTLLSPLAVAAETVPMVDKVAAVVIGFAAGETALVNGGQTALVQQDAPGSFHGTTDVGGAPFTFVVSEEAHCVFLAHFNMPGNDIRLRFDFAGLRGVAFTKTEEQTGYARYLVALEGPEGMVKGSAGGEPLAATGSSSPIGTSLAADELAAAADAIVAACGEA